MTFTYFNWLQMPAPHRNIATKAVRLLSLPISLPAFACKDHPSPLAYIRIRCDAFDQRTALSHGQQGTTAGIVKISLVFYLVIDTDVSLHN